MPLPSVSRTIGEARSRGVRELRRDLAKELEDLEDEAREKEKVRDRGRRIREREGEVNFLGICLCHRRLVVFPYLLLRTSYD